MPYSPPSDFTSSTTVSSMDASSELTYTGFVLAAAAAASQNIDDFAEEGNSNVGVGVAAMHSGLLANDLKVMAQYSRAKVVLCHTTHT